ncbi:hypothetical protein G6F58_013392 [Rhizopus delemar]|nr:hypothetical protein G6F58_013392 [Rhizopus delemar]
MADSGPALSAEASASLPSGSCWALSCPDGGFDAGLAAALGAGFRPSTTSSGDAAPLSRTAPRSMLAALSTNARSVLMPQCGLAPGFIGIVGNALARRFDT